MIGCLAWPLKAAAVLILILALAAAWFYRDRLGPMVDRILNRSAAAETVGRPGTDALRRAGDKVDSLNGWRADSIVLTASEAASLIGAGLDRTVRGELDSLEVRLGRDRVELSGVLNTRRVPRSLLGPFADAIGDRERVVAGGELMMGRPGLAVWDIDQLQIGDFPFPKDVVPRVVEEAFGGSARGGVPLRLPEGIGGLKVRPAGVTVYPDRTEP